MTYPAAATHSGPALFVAASATIAGLVCCLVYLVSLLLTAAHLDAVHALGVVSVSGLFVAAPLAIATSLFLRCGACGRLLLPLIYDGKTLFAAKSPSAVAILGTAVAIVLRRRAACPHCGVEARV